MREPEHFDEYEEDEPGDFHRPPWGPPPPPPPFWGPPPLFGPLRGLGCLITLIPLLILAMMLFRPH